MQPLHLLYSRRGLAAALVGCALVAPALGTIVQPNLSGTPDDGLLCRTGYAGSYTGGKFKCTKSRFHIVNLDCTNPTFTRYLARPAGSAGTPQGRDICLRNGINVGSTDSVVALVQGQDFVLAAVNTTALSTDVTNLDREEATALGLDAAREVDTTAGEPVIQHDQGTGSRDRAVVQVLHYTFGIPTGGMLPAPR